MVTETIDDIRLHVHEWSIAKRYIFSHPHGYVMLEIMKAGMPELVVKGDSIDTIINEGCGFIHSLGVDDDHRRQGIATKLLDLAEAIAEAEGLESVAMEWSEEDTPVEILEWYTRRGYAEMAFSNGCSLLRKTLKT